MAFAEGQFEGRISCYQGLKHDARFTRAKVFNWKESSKIDSLSSYAKALFNKSETKNLLIFPTKRNDERGFYIFTDQGSYWHKLPKLEKAGEMTTLHYVIKNSAISAHPLYITYFDFVEKNGAEYFNKSVTLDTEKPQLATFQDMTLAQDYNYGIEDEFKTDLTTMVTSVKDIFENKMRLYPKEIKENMELTLKNLSHCKEKLTKSDKSIEDNVNAVSDSIKDKFKNAPVETPVIQK